MGRRHSASTSEESPSSLVTPSCSSSEDPRVLFPLCEIQEGEHRNKRTERREDDIRRSAKKEPVLAVGIESAGFDFLLRWHVVLLADDGSAALGLSGVRIIDGAELGVAVGKITLDEVCGH